MSLNGNLEDFPLEEVLRLLARSKKTGCLRVETEGLQGKVFVAGGGIAFATIRADQDLRSDLLAAGMVREVDWPEVESRARTVAQALAPGVEPATLVSFIREHVVEALFRLRRPGHGDFDFVSELQPRYDTGHRLDVDAAVEESERRMAQWAEIESVIPGMAFRLRMAPTLPGEREITISPDTWKLLAALNGEGTVSGLAEQLGTSEFQVARAMAALVRAELVVVVDKLTSARYGYGEPLSEPTETARYASPTVEIKRPPAAAAPAEDNSFLSGVFAQLHGEPEPPAEDSAERFADPDPTDQKKPEPPKPTSPTSAIGLLRRRGLGALRELNENNG